MLGAAHKECASYHLDLALTGTTSSLVLAGIIIAG